MSASSYLSSSDVRAHFGLGLDTRVKTVQILWPSGYQQTLKDVQGDRYVTVEEPPTTEGPNRLRRFTTPLTFHPRDVKNGGFAPSKK